MHPTRRHVLLAAAAFALAPALPAEAAVRRLGGPAFGGSWRAVLPGNADGDAARRALAFEIASVDAAMSPYRSSSALVRFNAARDTGWLAVAPALAQVAASALSVATLTRGAFDPTLGPIVHRFGFGPIRGGRGDPGALSVRGDMIRKEDTVLTLDLCGIAKGHALDRMAASLVALGIPDFLIELGGEVIARGRHPDGRDWLVAVEQPGTTTAQRIVRPSGLALATSGHSANGHPRRRLSHIIDPLTARPAANGLAAVTVLAPNAERADALATALLVMGPERGPDLAEAQKIKALFLADDGGGIREIMTGGFADHVEI